MPRAGREAAEHGVARPSAESDSETARDRELQRYQLHDVNELIHASSSAVPAASTACEAKGGMR